ncbi:carboxypeptidase-like regulatory domain-containing protein [Planctomicrobium sp. SH527]|uniref:carboxypeptidase-like regulatory domain-containing protein n=1 Tax=Planctomicrobium sp. SH527 TaxID=3448123 RepID=UPI003F5BD699
MRIQLRSTICGAIALLAVGVMGCGQASDAPTLVKVSGVVTFKQKPLANAQVLFTPQTGPMAFGETDAEGRFTLQTGGKQGALEGAHAVTISAYEPVKPPAPGKEEEAQPLIPRIPPKYSNLLNSGLKAEVKSSEPNEFTFEL